MIAILLLTTILLDTILITTIQLPVEALLLQYQDPSATSFVINFTIIYLKMGFPRLPIEKQAELVPSVLAGIEAKPSMHQDSLLLMIMPVLGEVAKTAPTDPEKKRALLGLCEKPSVSRVLNSFMFDYLLLPYGSHPSIKPAEGAKETGVQVQNLFPAIQSWNLSDFLVGAARPVRVFMEKSCRRNDSHF